ncbi:DegT/DnrJ/EryC1/StrS family aminotransferase [Bacteroidetes bacterium endosymbiont of Geopemphigus sp.]|uniref:DegT/DnrJ/EryC1/StrS family aminotransferase n=1 Tax=Bacteroidetes bacterium endosymbiont of Geopemphigus sp. TaxID=2047937 RepID=UPI000CD2D72E|nr:DegT/DnrJ/EryC1/StrS family aminotransferase [Bacteroidetes bacterium endosymbiont of Geopemphigus sp.]
MVDLKGQYEKIKSQIDYAILETVRSCNYINGPEVKAFSEELAHHLGTSNSIVCSSGTDALLAALMALDLKEGDEVITTDFTFAATIEVILLLKLTPVLVDIDEKTFHMKVSAVEKAITANTKAIVPVHLFGQCVDMEPLLRIAERYEIFIVEDAAQALGASCRFSDGSIYKAGTMGHIGTTSFFPSKNLGCYGDGGAIFTDDTHLAERLHAIVNHGMHKRYYHDELGINSRLDSLQAAVLRVKLPYLDEYNTSRKKAADRYDSILSTCPAIKIPYRDKKSTHVFHQYTLLVPAIKRFALRKYLNEKGISSSIYYPVPLHRQKAYRSWRNPESAFDTTDRITDEVLSLPMHTELTEEHIEHIGSELISFFN